MPTFLEQCDQVLAHMPRLMSQIPLYIRTEEEGFRVIEANKVQLHYHNDRLSRGFGAHDAILKSRKHGFSTWKVLEALVLALYVPGFAAGIVVHEKDAAQKVFKILRWAYDRLPDDLKREKPLNADRRDEIEIGGSTIYVYTAGGRAAGRGETFHMLHMTEVGFWSNPEDAVPGLTEAVPRSGHICFESTPNGRAGNGGFWYETCKNAEYPPEDRPGSTSYRLHFYPWWWGDENSLPLNPGERIVPTDEEEDVIRSARKGGFDLTLEQIKWRRWKREDLREKFYQEQAEDPETCFLMSGNPLIDPQLMRRLLQHAEAQPPMMEDRTGDMELIRWRMPHKTYPYIVAVDVAEGLPHGDYTVITTWQNSPEAFFNVARRRLKCTTDQAAVLAVEEAKLYHDALIIVERNSIGAQVVRKINEDLSYPNQYFQIDADGNETSHLGWYTNARSKRVMVDEFITNVHAGDMVSYDRELWAETANITRDEMGRASTPKNKHDDCFMAACLANMARDQASLHRGAVMATYI